VGNFSPSHIYTVYTNYFPFFLCFFLFSLLVWLLVPTNCKRRVFFSHLITLNDKNTLGRAPLEEGSAISYTYNSQNTTLTANRQISMLPTGFEPVISSKQVASGTGLILARSASVRPSVVNKQVCHLFLIPCTVHILLLCTQTNKCTQLFHKLSHCYMFRHYRVILRQPVINTLPSYSKYFKCSCW
jgi:hypothetical protein